MDLELKMIASVSNSPRRNNFLIFAGIMVVIWTTETLLYGGRTTKVQSRGGGKNGLRRTLKYQIRQLAVKTWMLLSRFEQMETQRSFESESDISFGYYLNERGSKGASGMCAGVEMIDKACWSISVRVGSSTK